MLRGAAHFQKTFLESTRLLMAAAHARFGGKSNNFEVFLFCLFIIFFIGNYYDCVFACYADVILVGGNALKSYAPIFSHT